MATDDFIETSTGRKFHLMNPSPSEVDIRDIAKGLANTCRFGGQTKWHYSVAQHSLLVSLLVPRFQALEALLHDAAEAYIGDMVRPMKVNADLGDYLAIEERVEWAIREHFGLESIKTQAIKNADMQILAAERDRMMPGDTGDWQCLEGIKPASVVIHRMTPEEAFREFLDRYNFIESEYRVYRGPRVGEFLG